MDSLSMHSRHNTYRTKARAVQLQDSKLVQMQASHVHTVAENMNEIIVQHSENSVTSMPN